MRRTGKPSHDGIEFAATESAAASLAACVSLTEMPSEAVALRVPSCPLPSWARLPVWLQPSIPENTAKTSMHTAKQTAGQLGPALYFQGFESAIHRRGRPASGRNSGCPIHRAFFARWVGDHKGQPSAIGPFRLPSCFCLVSHRRSRPTRDENFGCPIHRASFARWGGDHKAKPSAIGSFHPPSCFLSGHDFSRADKANRIRRALAPARCLFGTSSRFRPSSAPRKPPLCNAPPRGLCPPRFAERMPEPRPSRCGPS